MFRNDHLIRLEKYREDIETIKELMLYFGCDEKYCDSQEVFGIKEKRSVLYKELKGFYKLRETGG